MGLSMREGIRIAAEEFNAGGGLLGRRIEFRRARRRGELTSRRADRARLHPLRRVTPDSASSIPVSRSPASAITRWRASGDHLGRHRPAHPAQFQPPISPRTVLRSASPPATPCRPVVIVEEGGRPARLDPARDPARRHQLTGAGASQDSSQPWGTRGGTAVVVERFQLRETDMRPQLERARAAGAQAVLTYGIGPELAHIANSMARPRMAGADHRQLDAGHVELHRTRRPQRRGRTHATDLHRRGTQPGAGGLPWRGSATGSVRIPVPPAAAQGYDSMQLLAAAIRQAGSPDGPMHPRGARNRMRRSMA